MRTKIMNSYDVAVARHNIKSIEDVLGHPIPAGMVDYESISDRPMNLLEVEIMATNIKNISDTRRYVSHRYNPDVGLGFFGKLLSLVVIVPIAYGVLSLVYAVLSTLLMLI